MKTTKKQLKSLALQILCCLTNEQVRASLGDSRLVSFYQIIASDFALNFSTKRLTDYLTVYSSYIDYIHSFMKDEN